MASAKLSPRQKMINLMYLVFIAMLAMNMSKKVLSSFGNTMEKLKDNNVRVASNNANILENLSKKATEEPAKYQKKNETAQKVKQLSDTYYDYLQGVWDKLKEEAPSEDYEEWDSDEPVNNLFFAKDGKLSPAGQEFLDNLVNYRESVIKLIDNQELKDQIAKRFSTDDEPSGSNKKKMIPFMNAQYEGFPLVTTLKNITQIQTDIRNTESDIYNNLLGNTLMEASNLNMYTGIVALDKTAYFTGETVTGKIVMGKYDPTFKPAKFESNVGGKVESGQVKLNFRASNPGTHPIQGKFVFKQKDGKDIEVPFSSEYTVITEPNEAVISADKMNVVYRGLKNPLSISVPGVGEKDIKASAPGLSKVGKSKYILIPQSGKEVTINVSAKLSSGKTIHSKKIFRIMDVPAPQGAIRGETGHISMPKASLARASVGVILRDFVFDLTLRTTGFKVKVPGSATVTVNGARMNAKAAAAINKARRGDVVAIFDIKSKLVGEGSGLRIKKASTVLVEIK